MKHYSRISVVLIDAQKRSTVANRIVHISVQLFSNEHLAVYLTEQHNLLLTIILSLANMIQSIRVPSSLEGNIITFSLSFFFHMFSFTVVGIPHCIYNS